MMTPAPGCYRAHWPFPLNLEEVTPVLQRSFTQSTGAKRFITVYEPGPWTDSFYFVMSPSNTPHSILNSKHKGVFFDSNRNGIADCFILSGGTLPNKRGKPIPYNFFVTDRNGDGAIEEFIMEDLDLDEDRIMDKNTVAVLMEPDPEGHFTQGAYLQKGTITPIPKDGSAFYLRKPLWKDPFAFADDEVTKMKLFGELQKIWGELRNN